WRQRRVSASRFWAPPCRGGSCVVTKASSATRRRRPPFRHVWLEAPTDARDISAMRALITPLFAFTLPAFGDRHPGSNQYGANPNLPAPQSGMIPTIKTAQAVGWPANGAPHAPAGFTVTRYAEGLNHPRLPYLLPNGDVLVVESSTQASNGGMQEWIA